MNNKNYSAIADIKKVFEDTISIALSTDRASFKELAKAAGLDPSRHFRGARLAGVDLRDEDLSGFDFSDADLSGADFRRAKIDRSVFARANLSNAIGIDSSKSRAPKGFSEMAVNFFVFSGIMPPKDWIPFIQSISLHKILHKNFLRQYKKIVMESEKIDQLDLFDIDQSTWSEGLVRKTNLFDEAIENFYLSRSKSFSPASSRVKKLYANTKLFSDVSSSNLSSVKIGPEEEAFFSVSKKIDGSVSIKIDHVMHQISGELRRRYVEAIRNHYFNEYASIYTLIQRNRIEIENVIRKLLYLREIDFPFAPFKNASFLQDLHFIEKINLSCSDLTNVDDIFRLPRIDDLNISFCHLRNLNENKLYTPLTKINASHTLLENIDEIENSRKVQYLNLRGTLVVNLRSFSVFPNLSYLDILETPIERKVQINKKSKRKSPKFDWWPVAHVSTVIGRPENWRELSPPPPPD